MTYLSASGRLAAVDRIRDCGSSTSCRPDGLDWAYARRLAYASAFATPERDALVYACKPPRTGLTLMLRVLRERWVWQTATAMRAPRPGVAGRREAGVRPG